MIDATKLRERQASQWFLQFSDRCSEVLLGRAIRELVRPIQLSSSINEDGFDVITSRDGRPQIHRGYRYEEFKHQASLFRFFSGFRSSIPALRRLSHDEERELAGLIADGDRDARNRLVQANLPLVVKIARDFLGRGMKLDDLIGEGNLGLIRAAEEFDPFRDAFQHLCRLLDQAVHSPRPDQYNEHDSSARPHVQPVDQVATCRASPRSRTRQAPSLEDVASVLRLSETKRCL